MDNVVVWQWVLVIIPSVIFFFTAPLAKTKEAFFKAAYKNKQPNLFMLTGSLVISWIFAKSITNAANLGLDYGIVGGVAYGVYYLSFVVAGIVIYKLRAVGYKSIHEFLTSKYGRGAVLLFSLLISIRLFNEIWSNTMVIGTYFGETGSTPFYSAVIVFTLLTLAYSLKGGLSSSIFTDVIQLFLFLALLIIILYILFSNDDFTTQTVVSSGVWSMETGGNLILVALLQVLSYPFHDPVMTDRGFISDKKTTIKSFLLASVLGFIGIVLFSLIGVYAKMNGYAGQAAVAVGQSLGVIVMLIINFIMITSAASTLDSTFSSFSKLIAFDLKIGQSLTWGRIAMVMVAVIGSIPVFLGAEILAATTVSGTMVMGLAPIFVFWKIKAPRISFYLSVVNGLFFGFLLLIEGLPSQWILTDGPYSLLLWINAWGLLSCIILFFIPVVIQKILESRTKPSLSA